MEYSMDKALEILERTPAVLSKLLMNLSDEWIYSNEGEDTWSPFDIVGHLIHGEKTDWLTRVQVILSEGENKTFQPFDRFAQFDASTGRSLEVLLKEFEILRIQNLNHLRSLQFTDDDLDNEGIHPSLGKVTLKQLLATWVTHDLGHIAQISRTMAKQYKAEVGPWLAYISVLNR